VRFRIGRRSRWLYPTMALRQYLLGSWVCCWSSDGVCLWGLAVGFWDVLGLHWRGRTWGVSLLSVAGWQWLPARRWCTMYCGFLPGAGRGEYLIFLKRVLVERVVAKGSWQWGRSWGWASRRLALVERIEVPKPRAADRQFCVVGG